MTNAMLADNYQEAVAILRANLTPRQAELDILDRYVQGTQYEGRRDFFDDSVQLWERAPCIVYTLAATAIRSNVDLVVGESRFPAITSNPGEDDSEPEGLDREQSKAVDKAISDICERVRFRSVARQALKHAQATKSVATIIGVRNGRPFLELVRSAWCVPTFGPLGEVSRLEIRYPYLEQVKQADGKWKLATKLYRRVIDAVGDTTYLPIMADPNGVEPLEAAWKADKDRTVAAHGLGFCPVVWYAHDKDCDTVADFDGRAIHQDQLDEIRGLDFGISVRHRAALFTGNPVILEMGVEPGSNPGNAGVSSPMPSTMQGGKPSASNPISGHYHGNERSKGRRVAPGEVWQYENEKSTASYLTLPPDALKALDEHIADLRNKLSEGLCVVILDPENVKHAAAMSGKAIESIRARQFDRCDQIRDDFGGGWLMPVALMLLRVTLITKVRIPSVLKVRGDLEKFVADDASAPGLFIRWPNGYLRSGPQEEQFTVAAVVQAYTSNLITLRTAVQKLSDVFQIENVDEAVETLEEELVEKQAKAVENAAAMASAVPPKGAKPGESPKGGADKESE